MGKISKNLNEITTMVFCEYCLKILNNSKQKPNALRVGFIPGSLDISKCIFILIDPGEKNQINSYTLKRFPGDSDSKETTCNVGNLISIPGLGRSPGGGHGNPLQYSCLENPRGQRSLVGDSSWGYKELDTTE